MLFVVDVILPIFALILAGYVCRKTGCLGESAASELNKFVIWLCLPALLFKATATATWRQIWHPEFILVFTLGTGLIFFITLLYRLRSRHLADASMDALGASYANTGYIGIPLCLIVLGDLGLQPALIATLIVVCLLFALATVVVEASIQPGTAWHRSSGTVFLALAKNPLVITPMLGAVWAATGLPIAQPIGKLLQLLGDATTPCALVSLGAFLAHKQSGSRRGTLGLVSLKLFVHPALTWLLATYVFHLPIFWGKAAVLLSALPTGTGPFMLAEYYRREASVISHTILWSTLASLVTLSFCLYWIKG